MNKKAGLYIGAVALAAIAIIATISFNSISSAGAQESKSQADAILNLKWEMQNAQFVAGKAIADALADASYSPCGYDESTATEKINGYLTTVKTRAFPNCGFSGLSLSGAGNPANLIVSLEIACTKDSGSLQASYTKSVEFKKKVETSGNCSVIVTNTDSMPAEIEVDKTWP